MGQRDVRQPYVGKVSGDFHCLPSAGDLKFISKMPLLGVGLKADRAHPQLAGGCWLLRVPKSSWNLMIP